MSFLTRLALLVAGAATYFFSPDDVVWRFIRTRPHARILEHGIFGAAAAILGIALLLRIEARGRQESHDSSHAGAAVASLLQSAGIGSLLPLPGFLLLVIGDLAVSLLLDRRSGEGPAVGAASGTAGKGRPGFWWRGGLAANIGLLCAFISMVIFSVTLRDRLADVLFALSALVSVAASLRGALR